MLHLSTLKMQSGECSTTQNSTDVCSITDLIQVITQLQNLGVILIQNVNHVHVKYNPFIVLIEVCTDIDHITYFFLLLNNNLKTKNSNDKRNY